MRSRLIQCKIHINKSITNLFDEWKKIWPHIFLGLISFFPLTLATSCLMFCWLPTFRNYLSFPALTVRQSAAKCNSLQRLSTVWTWHTSGGRQILDTLQEPVSAEPFIFLYALPPPLSCSLFPSCSPSFPVVLVFYCMALVNAFPLISCQTLNTQLFLVFGEHFHLLWKEETALHVFPPQKYLLGMCRS